MVSCILHTDATWGHWNWPNWLSFPCCGQFFRKIPWVVSNCIIKWAMPQLRWIIHKVNVAFSLIVSVDFNKRLLSIKQFLVRVTSQRQGAKRHGGQRRKCMWLAEEAFPMWRERPRMPSPLPAGVRRHTAEHPAHLQCQNQWACERFGNYFFATFLCSHCKWGARKSILYTCYDLGRLEWWNS